MKKIIKKVPWTMVLGYGLQVIGSMLTDSDDSNKSNHRGNNFKSNRRR